MSILGNLGRFFFQKRGNAFGVAETERRNDMRYNALYALDPDVLVRHLAAFARGDICGLERVLEEFEAREDKMRIGAFKMAAAVASKPWEVRVAKGEEENPRAARHKEVLTRFWNRAVATDAFCRNRKGGVRLLVKQMMGAQSRVYSVHDIVWKVHGDGSLSAEFTHVPAWCFENRSGRLRYIRNDGDSRGEEMRDGEWMVTVGEGVGIAAAILAMAKRLSWNDWLLFSEKCGMPVIMGNTSAQRGSPAWKAMEKAIKAIAPKTGLLADTGTQLNAVSMGGSGKDTYRALVDTVDRAISALYRGGDLATVSSEPSAAGVNAQQGESELMDADGCAMVSETLRDQVERFVVRFECGDEVPLAGIVINPPAETLDTEREIRIDQHLAALGVQLSKADALARYGRAEAKEEGDALKAGGDAAPPAAAVDGRPPAGGFGGFRQALHNERKGEASPLLRAFAKDTGPAAARMEALLERLDAGEDVTAEARKLAGELPGLMKGEPEMAAVLEEEMAKAFAEGLGGGAGDDEATKGRGDEGGEGNGETHAEAQRGGGAEGKPVAMANSGTSEGAKKGWETRIRNGWTPKQLSENKAKVDELIRDLDKRGPENSKAWKNTPQDLGEISQSLADDIHAANPNIKATVGTMQTIDQDQLNHALEEHGVGKEKRPNQVPITKEDLSRIPDVLSSYDEIVPGLGKKDGKQQEGVVFRKAYEDGTVCCVEIDWFRRGDKRAELKFQTMWKENPEGKR